MADSTGRFTQSGPFRALLAEFVIEDQDDTLGPPGSIITRLVHNECGMDALDSVSDESMDVLIDAVLNHDCEAE